MCRRRARLPSAAAPPAAQAPAPWTARGSPRTRLWTLVKGTDLAWVHPPSFRNTLATVAAETHGEEAAGDMLGHKPGSEGTRKHYSEVSRVRLLDPRHPFGGGRDEQPAQEDPEAS